jgi:GNAT superfamily N-acetyltransferase
MTAMPVPSIRPLSPDDAAACDGIIASLPYFFGDPDGVRDCAAAVRSQPGFVAEMDGRVVAFLTLMRHNAASAEITWMAAHADHRRHGLGRALIDASVASLRSDGVRMLCVLTLGPSVPEDPGDNYAGTRAFYDSAGFIPLRELDLSTWNDSHALILARAL